MIKNLFFLQSQPRLISIGLIKFSNKIQISLKGKIRSIITLILIMIKIGRLNKYTSSVVKLNNLIKELKLMEIKTKNQMASNMKLKV